MRFRLYEDNPSTLKEWAKQLNAATKGIYPLYSTVENTIDHWKNELNKTIGTNTFELSSTPEQTLYNWQDKLNGIFNI